MIGKFLMSLIAGDRNVVKETVEVFRPNAENQAAREADYNTAALAQFAAEFQHERKGWFDRLVDGLNRLPRPLMAFGVIGLFVAALVAPVWFAARMQGFALIPEPLWWLLGVVVSFYFGARHQAKSQEFQNAIASTLARTSTVVENIREIESLHSASPGVAATNGDAEAEITATEPTDNPALRDWARESK